MKNFVVIFSGEKVIKKIWLYTQYAFDIVWDTHICRFRWLTLYKNEIYRQEWGLPTLSIIKIEHFEFEFCSQNLTIGSTYECLKILLFLLKSFMKHLMHKLTGNLSKVSFWSKNKYNHLKSNQLFPNIIKI